MWGIQNLVSLPLMDEVSSCGDTGVPFILRNEGSDIANLFINLADGVVKEVFNLSQNRTVAPSLEFDAVQNVVNYGGKTVSPKNLRCDCRCAVCVEEFTGKALLDKTMVPENVKPLGMAPIGRYAMSVDWSDGHKSLFPFKQVENLMGK